MLFLSYLIHFLKNAIFVDFVNTLFTKWDQLIKFFKNMANRFINITGNFQVPTVYKFNVYFYSTIIIETFVTWNIEKYSPRTRHLFKLITVLWLGRSGTRTKAKTFVLQKKQQSEGKTFVKRWGSDCQVDCHLKVH